MIKLIVALIALTITISVFPQPENTAPKPLFADPSYNGSCDPEIIWNTYEQEWWIFYTGRRPRVQDGIYAGCAIGVATSKNLLDWNFKGYIKVDGVGGMADSPDTYWAPGIIQNGDEYHMFVTFKKGHPGLWGGDVAILVQLKAPKEDLLNGWVTVQTLPTYPNGIDAGLIQKDSLYYLYHRDIERGQEGNSKGVTTRYMTSTDLIDWEFKGWAKGDINNIAVHGYKYQEAQYVFFWKDKYWLLTDPSGKDMAVYVSDDCENWKFNAVIIDTPGAHPTDASEGRHPSLAIVDNRAFIFYHCEPERQLQKENRKKGIFIPENYYAYLQVAELVLIDGKIMCDRDKPVVFPGK